MSKQVSLFSLGERTVIIGISTNWNSEMGWGEDVTIRGFSLLGGSIFQEGLGPRKTL